MKSQMSINIDKDAIQLRVFFLECDTKKWARHRMRCSRARSSPTARVIVTARFKAEVSRLKVTKAEILAKLVRYVLHRTLFYVCYALVIALRAFEI